MNPKQQIYWHTTVRMPGDTNLLPLPQKVDVAVIGGGFTGLSAARTLALRGATVAVLEENTIGWGASSRNGGMVLTGLKLGMETITRRYGREMAKQLFQCSLDAIDTVEQIVKEDAIDCGFARRGHLVVTNKPSHYTSLQQSAEFMEKEFNHRLRLVPRAQQRDEIGTDLYYGAAVDEASAGLNPAQFAAGLALAAEKAGATLHACARVNRIQRSIEGFTVETERGKLMARDVLVATSGYTGRATQQLQKKIIPIGSFIIATEELPDSVLHELNPNGRMIFDSRHYLNYFRIWDRRLIFGGRAAFFPESEQTLRSSAEILRGDMVHVYPQLKDAKVEYVWGGTLDFAFDMMTHVGQMNGLYYSLGYAGHGVAMATYLGKTTAEAMLDGSITRHPFASFPFPGAPLGLYDGRPWFLPFAGMWHRFLDWVE
jgi:glycine/D-amino acid oxidase-like deaminating enzyme